jgi:sigma-B regulation protein RsbU (phosphoserine phosphatase)
LGSRVISLIYELKNKKSKETGRIEVILSFDKLIDEVVKAAWWKSNKAYLVDDRGQVLASTVFQDEKRVDGHVFGASTGLEQDTLRAFQTQKSGMVFGRGTPPEEVSGYYRLMEAPWTMVVMAPGDRVMQPIISFKLMYMLSILVCITLILLLIRMVTGQVTSKIKDITIAANDLAKGHFGEPLQVTSKDELGELMFSFNSMSKQLRQRLTLKEALGIAREVQQNLLPKSGYSRNGVFVNGVTLYCDETGGDYYDIITFPDTPDRVAVVVGDVVGHGIGAALLMTTVRAHLRSRIVLDDDLAVVMNAVNHLLCEDTCKTGSFVTLFCLIVDRSKKSLSWVRAGHDPAIVYDKNTQQFNALKGSGVALGVDPEIEYCSNEMIYYDKELLVLLGSDGAWEVENSAGEQFGKERIRNILSENCDKRTDVIIDKLVTNIVKFKAETQQKDDITLALVKC